MNVEGCRAASTAANKLLFPSVPSVRRRKKKKKKHSNARSQPKFPPCRLLSSTIQPPWTLPSSSVPINLHLLSLDPRPLQPSNPFIKP